MSRGTPSMMALLGLVAVAGYQNRDKIAAMFGQRGQSTDTPPGQGAGAGGPAGTQTGGTGGLGGALGNILGGGAAAGGAGGLGGLLGGLGGNTSPGGFLNSGLRDLMNQFDQSGHGDVAQSWVGTGPNKEVSPQQLEQAIGPDALAKLTEHTGLSRDEILSRLSRELPQAVDQYTPEGRLPSGE